MKISTHKYVLFFIISFLLGLYINIPFIHIDRYRYIDMHIHRLYIFSLAGSIKVFNKTDQKINKTEKQNPTIS